VIWDQCTRFTLRERVSYTALELSAYPLHAIVEFNYVVVETISKQPGIRICKSEYPWKMQNHLFSNPSTSTVFPSKSRARVIRAT
jgi:hypothetical protein